MMRSMFSKITSEQKFTPKKERFVKLCLVIPLVIVKRYVFFLSHYPGMNLAVFRGESGRSYILDAYCPHLGANLGLGGTVDGDCIACPFHGWTFSGDDGKCVKIAYAEKGNVHLSFPVSSTFFVEGVIPCCTMQTAILPPAV